MHSVETPENFRLARKLIDDFKMHGLEHAVRLMSVAERGEARRLIRYALMLFESKVVLDVAREAVNPRGPRLAVVNDMPGVVHITQGHEEDEGA